MKIKDLIEKLLEYDQEMEVVKFESDNFYGDGYNLIDYFEVAEVFKNDSNGIRIFDYSDYERDGYSKHSIKVLSIS